MATVEYANTAFSALFRLCSFIFLRVVPVTQGKFVLPTLYLGYLLTYLALPTPVVVEAQPVATKAVSEKLLPAAPESNGVAHDDEQPPAKVEKQPDAIRSILLSLPTPLRRQRVLNLIINTLFLTASLDLLFHPYFDDASSVTFTRVGAVNPDSVKIVVRYPPIATANSLVKSENETYNVEDLDSRLHELRVQWRQLPTSPAAMESAVWKDGPIASLKLESDWVETVRLGGLYPSTIYEYRLAALNRTVLPYPAVPIAFRTFPDPRYATGSHFRFVVSSCLLPNFPYVPLQSRTIKGFDLLASYLWPAKKASVEAAAAPEVSVLEPLDEAIQMVDDTLDELKSSMSSSISSEVPESSPAPLPEVLDVTPPAEFMLFLGDFIYADVPVYFGDSQETYRRLYRRNYNSPSFRKIYEQLPVFHVYDDHEIYNNYVGQANDSAPPFPNAADAYSLYNHRANYGNKAATFRDDKTYYDFRYADVAFFVMDTRRYRSDVSNPEQEPHTMLGDEQLAALYDWLGKVNSTATFKFIVSSVPFTSLWTHEAVTDSWAAFASEKAALLEVLHTIPNVIMLSGDRHEFAAIRFTPDDPTGHEILEFSTSPMSMFYVPFLRTLKSRSEAVVKRVSSVLKLGENGEEEVHTEEQEIPAEVVEKYIPTGNFKWSAFEVDTRDADHPIVKLEMVADGRPAYNLVIKGVPIKLRSSTAIGAFVPESLRGMFDKLGLNPSKWF